VVIVRGEDKRSGFHPYGANVPLGQHHQKRPRAFDLHHNAAIRYTSEPVSTSAAMALFDAQKRLLLEKIKALEVV